jgi:hypothetical protein
MSLVATICSYIYVLDFGQRIFAGPTANAMASELVRAAYLGSDAVEMGSGDTHDTDVDGELVPHA